MKLTADRLKQFSNECVALRRVLERGLDLDDTDHRLLSSHVQDLLAELDHQRAKAGAQREPRRDRSASSRRA